MKLFSILFLALAGLFVAAGPAAAHEGHQDRAAIERAANGVSSFFTPDTTPNTTADCDGRSCCAAGACCVALCGAVLAPPATAETDAPGFERHAGRAETFPGGVAGDGLLRPPRHVPS